ncbi:hypothetical protein vseg_007808 [Gypsophila vaccaria]
MQNTMEIGPKTSRKRKHSSTTQSSSLNTPFSGVLTRQKSQKFFSSRNRSGKSRQFSSARHPSVESRPKNMAHIDGGDDTGGRGGSVKDLRLRRVFSKPERVGDLVDERFDSRVDVGNPKFSILKKCNSSFTAVESTLSKEFDEFAVDLVVDGDDLVGGNPNLRIDLVEKCDSRVSDDVNPNLSDDLMKGEAVVEKCVVMNEEIVQTTPPEAVSLGPKSDEESRSCVSRSLDKQISPSKDRSSSVKEMTLTKCSRRKIFKVPNSFAYKRLLPYLMDMAKDEPCTLIDNPSVKIEIDVPKSPEKSLAIVEACGPQVVSTVENNEVLSDLKASSPADGSLSNLVSNESEIADDPKHDVSPDNLVAAFYIPETSNEIAKEDASFDFAIDDMEFKREGSLGTPVSSDAPVGGMTKGILKRNPWGCRGICSCLNCTSFRLNAEKAFEFSRNQLLEAEEVAQNLMKELSSVKCMLKKSVTGVTEVGAITLNQVEEACRRASDVEDTARARLSQMHEDLFVHSRTKALQRPRVNFSGNILECDVKELTNQTDDVRVGISPDLS